MVNHGFRAESERHLEMTGHFLTTLSPTEGWFIPCSMCYWVLQEFRTYYETILVGATLNLKISFHGVTHMKSNEIGVVVSNEI